MTFEQIIENIEHQANKAPAAYRLSLTDDIVEVSDSLWSKMAESTRSMWPNLFEDYPQSTLMTATGTKIVTEWMISHHIGDLMGFFEKHKGTNEPSYSDWTFLEFYDHVRCEILRERVLEYGGGPDYCAITEKLLHLVPDNELDVKIELNMMIDLGGLTQDYYNWLGMIDISAWNGWPEAKAILIKFFTKMNNEGKIRWPDYRVESTINEQSNSEQWDVW